MTTKGSPSAYYVERGKRLHRLNRNAGPGNFHMLPNGVFYGTGDTWAVTSADTFADTVKNRPDFATQSGPMLVIDGKLHPEIANDGASAHVRNGVGVGEDGRAYFVISDGPLSFGKFARYFRDALKVPNALYLDGKVSSLWDPARVDRQYGSTRPLDRCGTIGEKANYDPGYRQLRQLHLESGPLFDGTGCRSRSRATMRSALLRHWTWAPPVISSRPVPAPQMKRASASISVGACADAERTAAGGVQAGISQSASILAAHGATRRVDARQNQPGHARWNGRICGPTLAFHGHRYHSLIVTDIPDVLAVNATADDEHVMGFRHQPADPRGSIPKASPPNMGTACSPTSWLCAD